MWFNGEGASGARGGLNSAGAGDGGGKPGAGDSVDVAELRDDVGGVDVAEGSDTGRTVPKRAIDMSSAIVRAGCTGSP